MAISIDTVVWFVLYVLGCGLIFGLLMYLVNYLEREFPDIAMFAKFARIGLMVLGVLVLIGVVLSFITGHPILTVR